MCHTFKVWQILNYFPFELGKEGSPKTQNSPISPAGGGRGVDIAFCLSERSEESKKSLALFFKVGDRKIKFITKYASIFYQANNHQKYRLYL